MKKALFIIVASAVAFFISCASAPELPDADKQLLLLPQDLPELFAHYSPVKAVHNQLYFYTKTRTTLSGFSAVFAQQLSKGAGTIVNYTVQVSYCRTPNDAATTMRGYYTIEQKNSSYVKKADLAAFGADDVLLLQSDNLLYLAVRKGLIVYFIQIENMKVDLASVKNALAGKMAYLEKNPEEFSVANKRH